MSKRNKKYQGPKPPKRPENFYNFTDCLKWIKRSVYSVVRGRKSLIDGEEVINWTTLGSGFVAAPNRFLTAGHVINDPKKGELFEHREGDKYYLLKHDDEDNWHYSIFELILNKELFVFPDIDLGIIYLNEEFYKIGDKVLADKNDFIRISKDFSVIGLEVGVLGYPLSQLKFEEKDMNRPLIGSVLLRTDKGVINCRYKTSDQNFLYEFTMAFNPGNSGGPIVDIRTGRVVSIVHGYRTSPINIKEVEISDEQAKNMKLYKDKAFIEVLHATYSIGFATPSFLEIFKQHNILN